MSRYACESYRASCCPPLIVAQRCCPQRHCNCSSYRCYCRCCCSLLAAPTTLAGQRSHFCAGHCSWRLSTGCDGAAAVATTASDDALANPSPSRLNLLLPIVDSFDSDAAAIAADIVAELLLNCQRMRNCWNWGCCARIAVGIPTFQCGSSMA